jgi:hypothetical protein
MIFPVSEKLILHCKNMRSPIGDMLQSLFRSRIATNPIRSSFIKSTLPALRTMATGASQNQDLQANKVFNVSNYSVVVNSGGTGIGLMITQTLVANGAKVYITGRREGALENVVQKYNMGPGKIIPYIDCPTMNDTVC